MTDAEYDARVTAYVRRHGWPALLRAWVAKARAEQTPNPRSFIERERNLRSEISVAWRAMGDE